MDLAKKLLLLFFTLCFVSVAQADPSRLERSYTNLYHPTVNMLAEPSRSGTAAIIRQLSRVRDQMERGECSIFSATALLEAMLILKNQADPSLQLSTQWLAYVIARQSGIEGSDSLSNFKAIAKYGVPIEAALPYEGEYWSRRDYSELSLERCGSLHKRELKTCLIGHMSPALLGTDDAALLNPRSAKHYPAFAAARAEAIEQRDHFYPHITGSVVKSSDEIKDLLRQGIPLTLDFNFFDGAWNHEDAADFGIRISKDHWRRGIVGYPELGSVDRRRSSREAHSILIVGYDDNIEVSTVQLMNDGSRKRFTYRGVYYFKNSWGTRALGSKFELDGEKFPGYGMMTQKYAHEFGAFYQMKF